MRKSATTYAETPTGKKTIYSFALTCVATGPARVKALENFQNHFLSYLPIFWRQNKEFLDNLLEERMGILRVQKKIEHSDLNLNDFLNPLSPGLFTTPAYSPIFEEFELPEESFFEPPPKLQEKPFIENQPIRNLPETRIY